MILTALYRRSGAGFERYLGASVWGDAVLNGSLRNFPQRCGSAKHCWRSASLPPPS